MRSVGSQPGAFVQLPRAAFFFFIGLCLLRTGQELIVPSSLILCPWVTPSSLWRAGRAPAAPPPDAPPVPSTTQVPPPWGLPWGAGAALVLVAQCRAVGLQGGFLPVGLGLSWRTGGHTWAALPGLVPRTESHSHALWFLFPLHPVLPPLLSGVTQDSGQRLLAARGVFPEMHTENLRSAEPPPQPPPLCLPEARSPALLRPGRGRPCAGRKHLRFVVIVSLENR